MAREQRFRVARRGLVMANAGVAALGLVLAGGSLVTDRPWGSVIGMLLLAGVHGSMAFLFSRQSVVLTDEEIVATQGFQRARVAWDDVDRVHLDWAAEAAGRHREVLRIEQLSGPTVNSGAAAGMGGAIGGADATHLETALRERAADDGFRVEVTVPSWMARHRSAGPS